MFKRVWVAAICAIVGFFSGALASHLPGSSSEWASWVQAIGALLALAVTVGVVVYQTRVARRATIDAAVQSRIDAHDDEVRTLETARDIVVRMGATLAYIIDMTKPGANRGNYNMRADVQKIVTLGDLLKAVPMFEVRDLDALGEIVSALGEVDRYRIMVTKDAFNTPLGTTEDFEARSDRLTELIDELREKGPILPFHL